MLPDFHEIMMDTLRPYVMKGAAWLDEYEPGWVQKIVPERLDLSNGALCICGQMFGTYSNRPEVVEDATTYGFTLPDTDVFLRDFEDDENGAYYMGTMGVASTMWGALDRLWLSEVYWRLDPDGELGTATAI